jgi:regulator of sigma E protease
MNIPVNILALVFVLSVLIVVHEFGHYAVAKGFRFPVEVFSLGFGRRLVGWKRKETDYRVSLIPLGGYVKVVGLGPDESDVVAVEHAEPVVTGARWQRLLILFAGPIMNLLLAVVLTAGAFMIGMEVLKYPDETPVVKNVEPGSPAEKAGVKVDDVVVKLSGRPVSTWKEVELDLSAAPRQDIPLEIERAGQRITLTIRPEPMTKFQKAYDIGYVGLGPQVSAVVGSLVPGYPGAKAGLAVGDRIVAMEGREVSGYYQLVRRMGEAARVAGGRPPRPMEFLIERGDARLTITITPLEDGGSWKIGFSPKWETVWRKLGPVPALAAAVAELRGQARMTFDIVKRLVQGKASMRQLSGPIDIARMSGETARTGLAALFGFMGMLSLQLCILNLLPIPLLDGGQIFVTLLESLARRDFPLKVKERLLQAGFVFLVLVMATVLYFDVLKNVNF